MRSFFFAVLLSLVLVGSSNAQSAIFLVRHAEKATGGNGPANDPNLSKAGRARAKVLGRILKDAAITAIYATEFKRTQQTAEAVAQAAGVQVTVIRADDTAALVSKLKETHGNALVVGHTNTLPDIINALGLPTPSITIGEADYDNIFVVTAGAPPQLVRLHYP